MEMILMDVWFKFYVKWLSITVIAAGFSLTLLIKVSKALKWQILIPCKILAEASANERYVFIVEATTMTEWYIIF